MRQRQPGQIVEEKKVHVDIDGDLATRWQAMLDRKSIGQSQAIRGLILTALEQDDLGQSLFLRQVTDPGARRDLARLVLRRMAAETASKKKPRR